MITRHAGRNGIPRRHGEQDLSMATLDFARGKSAAIASLVFSKSTAHLLRQVASVFLWTSTNQRAASLIAWSVDGSAVYSDVTKTTASA